MSNITRRRLGSSLGDSNSAPPSDYSEGSENFEIIPDWSGNNVHHHSHRNKSNELYDERESQNLNDNVFTGNSNIICENEKIQIENFFSGLGTEVFVCSSLVNLYESFENGWQLIYTGIPVILLDKGTTRSRQKSQVKIILSERGSCFALWNEIIDNFSAYKVDGPTFHTMSIDETKKIGFSYDSSQAAREVWNCIEQLTNKTENIVIANGHKRKTKTKTKIPALPPKSQISLPCQFNHITNVSAEDTNRYLSLQVFVTKPSKHRDH